MVNNWNSYRGFISVNNHRNNEIGYFGPVRGFVNQNKQLIISTTLIKKNVQEIELLSCVHCSISPQHNELLRKRIFSISYT